MIIYKTINLLTGKIYVGKDCKNRPSYYGSGIWLRRAIKKYGKKNFKKEIVEHCTIKNISSREIYWINKLKARDPKVGYNIATGGDGGQLGIKDSVETIRKKRVASLGKKHTEEAKKLVSEKKKSAYKEGKIKKLYGKDNPFYGKKHSASTRKRMAEARRATALTIDSPKGMLGKKHSEETKLKMSRDRMGRTFSTETKKLLAEQKKGNKNPNFGKVYTRKERNKMSKIARRNWATRKGELI